MYPTCILRVSYVYLTCILRLRWGYEVDEDEDEDVDGLRSLQDMPKQAWHISLACIIFAKKDKKKNHE